MSSESKDVAVVSKVVEQPQIQIFSTADGFETGQRMAKALAGSDLVPQTYRGNVASCLIALDIAIRCKANVLMVMQNLYVIQGKPSWSAQYIIASLNSCGKFSPLRFKLNEERTVCTAWAVEHKTGEILQGPKASIQMAKEEGWYQKNGSKWKTMPELMLMYRSAAFFGRLYSPEILMGLTTVDEAEDMSDTSKTIKDMESLDSSAALTQKLKEKKKVVIEKIEDAPIVIEPGDFEKFEAAPLQDPMMVK